MYMLKLGWLTHVTGWEFSVSHVVTVAGEGYDQNILSSLGQVIYQCSHFNVSMSKNRLHMPIYQHLSSKVVAQKFTIKFRDKAETFMTGWLRKSTWAKRSMSQLNGDFNIRLFQASENVPIIFLFFFFSFPVPYLFRGRVQWPGRC